MPLPVPRLTIDMLAHNEPRQATEVIVWQPTALGREIALDLRQVFRGVCESAVQND